MEQKTSLYDLHQASGGKMVPFAGYLLPIQYSGIIEEHMAVREAAGIFDVSHMGEILLTGSDAVKTLNRLLSNDFTEIAPGRVRYSPMLNQNGGVIDDLLVYCLDKERYWLVVNAANREKDVAWVAENLVGDTQMEDISDSIAQIAIQGPKSQEILEKLTNIESIPGKYYTFIDKAMVAGMSTLLSHTGYTGSAGFEIYCSREDAPALWTALLEKGAPLGLVPCGLGARDTLRLEASMPLYGHEMNEEISPLETGLGFAVKMKKDDFIGKAALEKKGEPTITRVGLKVVGRGIVREDCPVHVGETQVGKTTSGTHLPYLQGAYAMALLDKKFAAPGTQLLVHVRGRGVEVEVVPMPFYKA